jgi:hypothetical protein
LDQDNLDRVAGLVDGAAGEGRGGTIRQGGLQFRVGPGERYRRKPGRTYVVTHKAQRVWLLYVPDSARSLHESWRVSPERLFD